LTLIDNKDRTEVDAVIEEVKRELRTVFVKTDEQIKRLGNALKKVVKREESICEEIKNALKEEIAEGVISTRTIELYCPPEWKHNFHFKIGINPNYYHELDIPYYDKNNGKRHSENIGTSRIDYVLYPNGTVDIHVRCSNSPFRLETEIDRNRIIAFFGQIRDRLIILLSDERERIVPDIMDWQITECDINKDIKIGPFFSY
jgi:hypothetical protein